MLGRSGLQYSENRPRDSKFECAQAQEIRPLQDQTCFRIAWRLRTNIICFRGVSIFLDILKTPCVTPVVCWKQWESQDAGQCLKSLEISKEAFYVFRRIKSENSWKWNKFKTVIYLPLSKHFTAAWSPPQKTAYFAFFPDFSHLFIDSDHFFRDPWVFLTFFPASTLVVYHIPIKIREKSNVLTQHSVNAHTKPSSEKQSLSESCKRSYQTFSIFRICAQRYWRWVPLLREETASFGPPALIKLIRATSLAPKWQIPWWNIENE